IASTWGQMLSSRRLQEPRVTPAARAFERSRLLSLDVFRGVAGAGMVLVTHHRHPPFLVATPAHAHRHRPSPVAPPFLALLFIVGVAIVQSMAFRNQYASARGALLRRILLRPLPLFVLGLLLNAFPFFDLASLRIPGVLQRIAICYLLASLAFLGLSVTGQA